VASYNLALGIKPGYGHQLLTLQKVFESVKYRNLFGHFVFYLGHFV